MIKALLFALCLTFALCFTPCEPFGPRTFYGGIVQDSRSTQKLQIYFNTVEECSQSYVQLVKKSGLQKISCTITALHLSKNVNNYSTYIHRCSISSINLEETFNYNIFGWDGKSSNPTPFAKDFIPIKIADITDTNKKINIIVLADWSHLDKNIGKYIPLDNLFASVGKEKEIHGLMINGDIGYDLDTNNCLNYEKFLVMLGETAKTIPVIMVTGNHQYNTKDNYQLFQQSFQLYKLDTQLATHLQIGPIYLLPFDPFEIVLGSSKTDPCIAKFNAVMADAKKSNKFILPISHYPLACSGTSKNCKNDRTLMKNYWKAMFDAKITFYLGAHYHTYQRIYPYHADDTFSHQASGYKSSDPFIVSIVEGVAGNDRDIVQSIATIQTFTAAYTINETGFGLLQVDNSLVSYTHYSTARGITDHTAITRVAKGNIRTE